MDHAAGVRWFQLVCSTAIANICLSVKWIISKKGFFFFVHFVRSSGSLWAEHIRAAAAALDFFLDFFFKSCSPRQHFISRFVMKNTSGRVSPLHEGSCFYKILKNWNLWKGLKVFILSDGGFPCWTRVTLDLGFGHEGAPSTPAGETRARWTFTLKNKSTWSRFVGTKRSEWMLLSDLVTIRTEI